MMQVRNWEDLNPVKDQVKVAAAFEKMGVQVEIESTSYGTVKDMVIKANGVELRLASGFSLYRRKPAVVDKYVLKGSVLMLPVNEMFDDHDAAFERQQYLTKDLASDQYKLDIKKEEVELQ